MTELFLITHNDFLHGQVLMHIESIYHYYFAD